MLARKVVRGIYYLQDGIFIERTHVIDHCLLHPTVAEEVLAPFGTGGQTFAREPCLRIRRFVAHDEKEIFKRSAKEFVSDNAFDLGAQQAYYCFFALFPALLTLISIASFFTLSNLIQQVITTLGQSCRRTC